MSEKRWLYFALGVTTVISVGAVTNQLVPLAPATGLSLSDSAIMFPDGTVQTTAAPRDPRRAFYLTTTGFNGDQADGTGVCDAGFHFASLFEILDVSSLRYDTGRGKSRSDSGQGPPSSSFGWIRTGNLSDGQQPNWNSLGDGGIRNCATWTTSSDSSDGTTVGLNWCWQEEADCVPSGWSESNVAQWWRAGEATCDTTYAVWCVEDSPGSGG